LDELGERMKRVSADDRQADRLSLMLFDKAPTRGALRQRREGDDLIRQIGSERRPPELGEKGRIRPRKELLELGLRPLILGARSSHVERTPLSCVLQTVKRSETMCPRIRLTLARATWDRSA